MIRGMGLVAQRMDIRGLKNNDRTDRHACIDEAGMIRGSGCMDIGGSGVDWAGSSWKLTLLAYGNLLILCVVDFSFEFGD